MDDEEKNITVKDGDHDFECEMDMNPADEETIKKVLLESKVIALVGMSSDPEKDSHKVGKYLMEAGFDVIPVNPTIGEVLGHKSYRSIKEIPGKVDVVDVFRPSREALEIIDDAIAIGAKTVWMQEGIVNNDAAKKGEAAGLTVIMNRCMKKTHKGMISRK